MTTPQPDLAYGHVRRVRAALVGAEHGVSVADFAPGAPARPDLKPKDAELSRAVTAVQAWINNGIVTLDELLSSERPPRLPVPGPVRTGYTPVADHIRGRRR